MGWCEVEGVGARRRVMLPPLERKMRITALRLMYSGMSSHDRRSSTLPERESNAGSAALQIGGPKFDRIAIILEEDGDARHEQKQLPEYGMRHMATLVPADGMTPDAQS